MLALIVLVPLTLRMVMFVTAPPKLALPLRLLLRRSGEAMNHGLQVPIVFAIKRSALVQQPLRYVDYDWRRAGRHIEVVALDVCNKIRGERCVRYQALWKLLRCLGMCARAVGALGPRGEKSEDVEGLHEAAPLQGYPHPRDGQGGLQAFEGAEIAPAELHRYLAAA